MSASGAALRDQGIQLVLGSAPHDWVELCERVIRYFALSGCEFNADDVVAQIGTSPRPNATGAVFLTMARRGVIERCGFKKIDRPSAHARTAAVWRGRRA